MIQGYCGGEGSGEGASCMAGAGPGIRCVLFVCESENQNIQPNKNNRTVNPKLLQKVSPVLRRHLNIDK